MTADITTAFTGGSYADGYVGTGVDRRVTTGPASRRSATWSPTRCVTRSTRPEPAAARDDRRRQPRRAARRAATTHPDGVDHLRRGERRAAVRQQPVDHVAHGRAVQDDARAAVADATPNGTVPTRPYLQLGLSDNVTLHVRRRAARRDRGSRRSRSTARRIDPAARYRIGTFSFLTTGGDNFRVFKQGNERHATRSRRPRRLDRVPPGPPRSRPDFARRSVSVSPATPITADAGQRLQFTVSKLDLTSLRRRRRIPCCTSRSPERKSDRTDHQRHGER